MRKAVVIFFYSFFVALMGNAQSSPQGQIQIPIDTFKFDFKESVDFQLLDKAEITGLMPMPVYKPNNFLDPMIFKPDTTSFHHLLIKTMPVKQPEPDSLQLKKDY